MNVVFNINRYFFRRAAYRYARHGWPVLPGAYLDADRFRCGPICPTVACHPALDQWLGAGSHRQTDIDDWWSAQPFSVLLTTGTVFDVIEVPATVGAAAAARTPPGPIAITPTGRWMFFVAAGETLSPDFDDHYDVVAHSHGSWVPAPPTRTPHGRLHWHTPPTWSQWRLPDPYAVQAVLAAHLRPLGRPTRVGRALPRPIARASARPSPFAHPAPLRFPPVILPSPLVTASVRRTNDRARLVEPRSGKPSKLPASIQAGLG